MTAIFVFFCFSIAALFPATNSLECFEQIETCRLNCSRKCHAINNCNDILGISYVCEPGWVKIVGLIFFCIFILSMTMCITCLCCPCCLLFKYCKRRKHSGRVIAPPPPQSNGQPIHTVYHVSYPPPPGYHVQASIVTRPPPGQAPPTYLQPFDQAQGQAAQINQLPNAYA